MSSSPEIRKRPLSALVFARVNRSFLKTLLHDVLFRNALAMRCMWGMQVPARFKSQPFGSNYADLTTLLLRGTLCRWVRANRMSRVHEIGIGHYGVLCLYLRKTFPELTISGSTISPVEVEHASETATLNGAAFDYYVSDVLASDNVTVDQGTVDMIWWNLPYYMPEVLDFVRRLRDQVREKQALSPGGLVVLGFNGVPLDAESVRAVFDDCDWLRVKRIETFAWNPHVILTLEHTAGK
jgi:hypothetical protein